MKSRLVHGGASPSITHAVRQPGWAIWRNWPEGGLGGASPHRAPVELTATRCGGGLKPDAFGGSCPSRSQARGGGPRALPLLHPPPGRPKEAPPRLPLRGRPPQSPRSSPATLSSSPFLFPAPPPPPPAPPPFAAIFSAPPHSATCSPLIGRERERRARDDGSRAPEAVGRPSPTPAEGHSGKRSFTPPPSPSVPVAMATGRAGAG